MFNKITISKNLCEDRFRYAAHQYDLMKLDKGEERLSGLLRESI
jgi:hypothetical protein